MNPTFLASLFGLVLSPYAPNNKKGEKGKLKPKKSKKPKPPKPKPKP